MDSGNSGSFQSSSGDEEHDSRPVDSISALMNVKGNKRRAIHGIQQNPSSQMNSANFDLLSNYFDAISRQQPPPSSLLNLDMSWSKNLRSDLNSSADHHHNNNPAAAMISPSSSNIQPFFGSSFSTATTTTINPQGTTTENNNNNSNNTPKSDHVVRNPKKRSRASRRAPTTVLTTDTTNFRAMVQEFTGIPAPPFTSCSSPFSRNTLYGPTTTPSSLRSNIIALDSSSSQPPPSYLRRPFPQKPPSLPFLASSSSASSSPSPLLSSTSMLDLDLDRTTPAALNFQVFNNIPNHLILSSALLQSKFPPPNPAPVQENIGLEMEIPSSKEIQFGHVNASSLGGLPGLIPSDQTTTARDNNNNNNNWGGGNGNLSFHGEKGSDHNVAASRGEGMVESWICSSD